MLDDFGNTIPGTEDAPVAVPAEPVPDAEPVAEVPVAEPVVEVAPEVAPVVESPVVEAEVQPEPECGAQVTPAADIVDKLEKILSAVGYDLPALWGEAVALARKTI